MFRYIRNHRNGFTLIEVLLSFGICFIIVLSLTPIVRLTSVKDFKLNNNEDIYIGIKQIAQHLIGSSYISHDDTYTYLSREQKEMIIYCQDNKIIKKPGYEVFLYDVKNLSFELIDQYVYMTFSRDEYDYRFMIAYANRVENIDEE